MMQPQPLKLNISKRLRENKAFRKRFFRRQAQDEIAMSIRSLREKRVMRQIDLAKKSGMKQSAISRIEQAGYSGWTFNTLLRVGSALDARLHLTLEPAETVIARYENQEVIATLKAGPKRVLFVHK
jgi:DNA-binding Xre family transcriptional regulator